MESMERLALLVEIVDRRVKRKKRVGKTVLQKLLFLLQEHFDLRIDYNFRFYNYGPYSTTVMGDIDYAVALRMLKQEYDPDQGFDFAIGPNASQIAAIRKRVCKEAKDKLDELFDCFGTLTARQLELRATVAYVKKQYPQSSGDEVLKIVKDLKPKYLERELRDAVGGFSEPKGGKPRRPHGSLPLRGKARQDKWT